MWRTLKEEHGPNYVEMKGVRLVVTGLLATVGSTIAWGLLPEVALLIGLLTGGGHELLWRGGVMRRQHRQILTIELTLDTTQHQLRESYSEIKSLSAELHRRDAVGAPEARKLLDIQADTLDAHHRAVKEARGFVEAQREWTESRELESKSDLSELTRLVEKMLAHQSDLSRQSQRELMESTLELQRNIAEGNQNMQALLAQLLERLAMEPRQQNVKMQDSVMMQSMGENKGWPKREDEEADRWLAALQEDLK